ncbi:PQQ-binding-like beta-propeller repeat protein [Streptomyces massasporeus]|uniref:PQQ-binding-like beta-propeller repeat protein n=1 Tax=Streptomyces massasporeus TaxID=67324 RepID=UPI0033EB151C
MSDAFAPARLSQARRLAGLTKKDVPEHLGVTPAAVGQYETVVSRPRQDLLPQLLHRRYLLADAWAPSSPTVVDGTLYIGSTDKTVYALDAATGQGGAP